MLRLLLAVVLVVAIAREARADCVGVDICTYFDYAASVFLADVIEVNGTDVTFDVLEGFKNARRGRRTLRVFTRNYEDDHRFRAGERLLVFLSRGQDGKLAVSGCGLSGTHAVTLDDPQIPVLRHFARGEAGAIVSGGLWPSDNNWYRRPYARLTLRSVSGLGPTFATTTGEGWGFVFPWVGPGLYVVALDGNARHGPQRHLIRVGTGQKCLTAPGFRIQER